ncbi:MAG: DHHA1 domain-containing protein [Chitinophagaceae bacterium]
MDPDFSVELCGGTHVGSTGMIGAFTIAAESAVAAGVRRVEALTGAAAMQYFAEKVTQAKQVSELLKSKDAVKSVERLMEEKNALEKRLEALEQKELGALAHTLAAAAVQINGVAFVGEMVDVNSADALRKMAPALKAALKDDFVVILTAAVDGKAQVLLQLGDTVAAKGMDASKLIKEHISGLIKGGGGGQKTMATAGGQDTTQLNKVIETIKGLL